MTLGSIQGATIDKTYSIYTKYYNASFSTSFVSAFNANPMTRTDQFSITISSPTLNWSLPTSGY